jgi:hypothetical protein
VTTILSYGGGKDSTALVAMDLNRDATAAFLGIPRDALDAALPHFEFAVFADTGAEFTVTYQTIARVSAELGGRFVKVAREGETITEWCLRLGIVPLLPGASHICSRKFKGDVLAAWAKAQAFTQVTWLIGIEADEGHRLKRFQAPAGDAVTYRYPLVDLGLNRDRLDALLVHLGWPNVHKSSCVFCPFMSEAELRDTYRDHPADWALVVEIEDAFARTSSLKHKAWIDAGKPLNAGGRAPRGMWRRDSWAEGARLFARSGGKGRLSVREWAARFDAEIPVRNLEN